MIRILQCVNKMDRAGLETMLMNYYRNVDRTKIQFDFLTHRSTTGEYDKEILEMGGKIFYAPRLVPQNFLKYRKFMKKLFKNNQYDIVHSHIDTMSFFPLREAKRNNIKYRISHSHTSKLDFDYKLIIKLYCKIFINKYANIRLACGNEAGKFLYKKRSFKIINNAIDYNKFQFNEEIRNRVRYKLNIDSDTTVLGHVGRYIYIKNQAFLIDIFKEYLKLNPNSKLILVGFGEDENKLREKVRNYGLNEKVIFLLNRNDTHELYQAMDYFVMPSLFEGVPLVAIESQCNGLTCVLSDNISEEAKISSSANFYNLGLGPEKWAKYIFHLSKKRNEKAIDDIKKYGYDIKTEAKKLEQFYISLDERAKRR